MRQRRRRVGPRRRSRSGRSHRPAERSHHRRHRRRRLRRRAREPQVTPSPIGDASIGCSGVDGFPFTGGNVTYYEPGSVSPFVQGERGRDSSGLSLTGGDTVVELTDFVIDPGVSVLTGTVSVDGEVAAEDAPLFFLDGRTLNPLQVTDNGTAVLESTTVKLKAEAAD